MNHKILLKRIYEPQDEQDGYRVLVDRLWPRGIKKETARLDEWAKEITPRTEYASCIIRGKCLLKDFLRLIAKNWMEIKPRRSLRVNAMTCWHRKT